MQTIELGGATSLRAGPGLPLVWVVRPRVAGDAERLERAAERVAKLAEKLAVPIVFSAADADDDAGPALDDVLESLAGIREEFGLPVLADVRRMEDLPGAGQVLDIIQIPAYLCEQGGLVLAAARTGRVVDVVKGASVSPAALSGMLARVEEKAEPRLLLTEAGAAFGHQGRIADMTAIPALQEIGYPVFADVAPALGRDEPDAVPALVRAAIATGANGIALEVHPDPGHTGHFPLDRLEPLLTSAGELAALVRGQGNA
jgi:2-dehydro-3-deoxyphosphooctonate aldolase (KDO 8-P synthase)